jgi:nitrogenase-associated protein
MALVTFYEKPGCISNARQKKLLQAAGHQIDVRNLLTAPWTSSRLQRFFANKPVTEWFNRSAPEIKSGSVKPEQLEPRMAMAKMLANPLLIRRPLMEVGGRCVAGFDPDEVEKRLGVSVGQGDKLSDVETCPQLESKLSSDS